ncbi:MULTISPECIES: hypothetical protein [unclassified Vibrio]|nr:hypothetical protein [Vibrio sp. Hep-1b-8]
MPNLIITASLAVSGVAKYRAAEGKTVLLSYRGSVPLTQLII